MAGIVTYQFLPWVRAGLASQLRTTDTLGGGVPGRARLDVGLTVTRQSGAPVVVTRGIEVIGPGDVVGIDRRQVIRTDPKPNATDFEPNFLAIIEFDRPEFPWLFTPAAANAQNRLRPWLVLVVVEVESEVSLEAQQGVSLPVLAIPTSARPSRQLPDLEESWAWAHGQVLISASERLEDILESDPARTASRLICPRQLAPNTSYLACVVPAFEAGRRAGLGLAPEAADDTALRPAWVAGSDAATALPVYYSWRFATGVGGDFESLAAALRARPIPPEVGRHDMFVGAAGAPLPAIAPGGDGAVVELRGALVPPLQRSVPWPRATRAQVQRGLQQVVDLPAQRLGSGGASVEGPAVAPPLYGRWLAARATVPPAASGPLWLRTLNLDPRHRAVAGLSTRVVQHEQERLMEQAWAQVGDIERANMELRWAQIAVEVRGSLLQRHIAPLTAGSLIQVTKAAHRRMLIGSSTLAATAEASALPEASLTAPFRRAVRPRGPLARRAYQPAARTTRPFVEGLATGKLAAASPERPPDGLFGFAMKGPARSGVQPDVRRRIADAASAAAERPPRVVTPAQVRAVPVPDPLARSVVERLLAAAGRPPAKGPPPALPPILPPILTKAQLAKVKSLAATFRETTARTIERIDRVADEPPAPPRPPFSSTTIRRQALARLDPARTVRERALGRITIPPSLRPTVPRDPLEAVLAAPTFPQPAWELLRDWFPEHLLPGLEHVPINTVSLMQTNPPFIEAFLVGINHELGRELLWREYPTDQRGTAFRRFWAASGHDDILPIHTWSAQADLGSSVVGGPTGHLVLLVRGDLLRRYPSTVIYAAPDSNGRPQLTESAVKLPLFRGGIPPDVTFVGFDLTPEDARSRWWFVFEEQPTEPRFALDVVTGFGAAAPSLNQWNDLTWGHLATDATSLAALSHIRVRDSGVPQPASAGPVWGSTAAAMASILAQQPVRISMRGADLLSPP